MENYPHVFRGENSTPFNLGWKITHRYFGEKTQPHLIWDGKLPSGRKFILGWKITLKYFGEKTHPQSNLRRKITLKEYGEEKCPPKVVLHSITSGVRTRNKKIAWASIPVFWSLVSGQLRKLLYTLWVTCLRFCRYVACVHHQGRASTRPTPWTSGNETS